MAFYLQEFIKMNPPATTETFLTWSTAAMQDGHGASFLKVWGGGRGGGRLNKNLDEQK